MLKIVLGIRNFLLMIFSLMNVCNVVIIGYNLDGYTY